MSYLYVNVATNFNLEALINLNQSRSSIKRNDHAEKTLYKIYFLDIWITRERLEEKNDGGGY